MALACSALLLAACGKNDTPAPAEPPPVSQSPAPSTTPEPATAPASEPAPAASSESEKAPEPAAASGLEPAAPGSAAATDTTPATAGDAGASGTTGAAASGTATAAAAAAAAAGGGELGKSVYEKSCALCHAAGVAGAPKLDDKSDWSPRIAQGKDTLYKHAIEGFTGKKGVMPPRGGAASLSDEEVKAAVDFMVSHGG
ncbi:c-type cytochrome [Melaminivora alkalimesophila]